MPVECGYYVKKRPVMKAERFLVDNEQWPEGVMSNLGRSPSLVNPYVYYSLEGDNGEHLAIHSGDWILTNTETGDKRVVPDFVLARDYEEVEGSL